MPASRYLCHEPRAARILASTSTTQAPSWTGSTDVRDSARRQRPPVRLPPRRRAPRRLSLVARQARQRRGRIRHIAAGIGIGHSHRHTPSHLRASEVPRPRRWRSAMRFFSPNTAPSSSRAPATGVSSRTYVGSPVRRGTWCRMRGWPRWLSNRGASGSLPIATTPVFQASAGGSRSEPRGRGRFKSMPGTLPFSCPLDATKSGKERQSAAQSETEKSRDFSGVDARSSSAPQRPAKRG